jgi:ribose transport system substrate-binding protein
MRARPLSLLFSLSLSLPSCSKPDKPPSKPRVALIMKSLANEFFHTMENGAKEHHKAHSGEYELISTGIKDELDVGRQIDLVDQMITAKVDAIIIAPADSKALGYVCRKALDAKIVVVNIDNKLDASVLAEKNLSVPFVGPDNRKGARMSGEALAKALKPGDPVAIIEGIASTDNGRQRKLGFEDAVKAGGLKIVASRPAMWETDQAKQVAAAMIAEHPDLRGILAGNDSMALGAAAAIQEAGKVEQILLVGFDAISPARALMREKRMLATVNQHADQLAIYGIEYALEILKNSAIPGDRETPVHLVTAETLTAQP